MPNQNPIVLKVGGSKEGTDYRFFADAETLKRLAHQILDCLENGKVGPWGSDSNLVAIEEIQRERGLFRTKFETAFLSFEKR